MEITKAAGGRRHILRLKGRFDANWASHVGGAIDQAIRGGHRTIELDLTEVNYISSAGVRVLLKSRRELKSAGGSLHVSGTDANVTDVIELSGLAELLLVDKSEAPVEVVGWSSAGTVFEQHLLEGGEPMAGALHGDPSLSRRGDAARPSSVAVRHNGVGVGIGAFGPSKNASERFGEWLMVAGASLAMPTDGSSVPDYHIAEHRYVPEATLLSGLTATGDFARFFRFEAGATVRGTILWTDLVRECLARTGFGTAALAVVAETAGVVGASLLRSPTAENTGPIFALPEVRDWLSFTGERDEQRAVSLISGFVSLDPIGPLSAFLRPMGTSPAASGHFHAAIFPYRPLPGGKLDLSPMASELASGGTAKTVLHMLRDDRTIGGVGETELMRGAVWMAPVDFGKEAVP